MLHLITYDHCIYLSQGKTRMCIHKRLLMLLCIPYGLSTRLSENLISDYATTADLNTTKVGFFYNQIKGEYVPLNQSNLDSITNYLTIGSIAYSEEGSHIKYYEHPNFRTVKSVKNITEGWIGARAMDKEIIDKWLFFASLPIDSPTIVWKIITNKCFGEIKKNQIELYQYSALVPSIRTNIFLYTFSWKIKGSGSKHCFQSTYSLTYRTITCQDYIVDCNPPY